MDRVKFIGTEYIKDYSIIEHNVDNDKIIPHIFDAQTMYLEKTLGSSFMEDLEQKIKGSSLNIDEKKLIDKYIQPMLLKYVVYLALPHLNSKVTNKSVSQENSEYSTSVTYNNIKELRKDRLNLGELLNIKLKKYLCDYSNLFPKYENPDDKENVSKSNKTFNNGIYLPKR